MTARGTAALASLVLILAIAGCARDGGQAAFRNRWWHFYERGLSRAEAGDRDGAEADLRQALQLRRTDSRRARTYGLHFVQCFAHRELGAVLLDQGRLDEAELLLETSRRQEPSAKTDALLERLRAVRSGTSPATAAAAAPPPRVELLAVQRDGEALAWRGRIIGGRDAVLWLRDAGGAAVRLAADAAGAFAVSAADGAALAVGDASGPAGQGVPLATPPAAPTLDLSGPEDGASVTDGVAWFRWQASAAAGLAELRVDDAQGAPLARARLGGLRSGGTIAVPLPAGEVRLRFTLAAADGSSGVLERQLRMFPAARQDRSLRAVAIATPVQYARGATAGSDDAGLVAALLADGRFRLLDRQADDILSRELALVEAGQIDRSTAAQAGRRLQARYVIAGTMNRSARDAECYLRLIHADSGEVVAAADAYVESGSGEHADALFAAAAGRLRQVFPVIDGGFSGAAGDGAIRMQLAHGMTATARLRLHLFPEAQTGARRSAAVAQAEVEGATAEELLARRISGTLPAGGWAVSE